MPELTVEWNPVRNTEKTAVSKLGNTGWQLILNKKSVSCLGNAAGILIEKGNKNFVDRRWIKESQVVKYS